jgi:hypothetical protein
LLCAEYTGVEAEAGTLQAATVARPATTAIKVAFFIAVSSSDRSLAIIGRPAQVICANAVPSKKSASVSIVYVVAFT